MNIANKLTIFRIILIPVFIMFEVCHDIPNNYLWGLVVFLLASFTDFLDGYLARKKNLITDFGKIMDPLADKMLIVSALIIFVDHVLVGSVSVIIIICREFLVTSIRILAASKGEVILADIWGKIKTVFQMIAVILIIMYQAFGESMAGDISWGLRVAGNVSMDIAVILTVISGVNYLVKNRKIWLEDKC